MAASDSTTVTAPRRWSFRTLLDPSGINFMLGLFAGPFMFQGISAFRHETWPEGGAAFAVLAVFVATGSGYTAVFNAATKRQ